MDPIAIAGTVILGLGTVIWWFMRHTHSRVEEERKARELAIESERKGREDDRHTLRSEIQTVAMKLQLHEVKVAEEYVSTERLAHALSPLESGIARVESTIERLFGELRHKVDKPGSD